MLTSKRNIMVLVMLIVVFVNTSCSNANDCFDTINNVAGCTDAVAGIFKWDYSHLKRACCEALESLTEDCWFIVFPHQPLVDVHGSGVDSTFLMVYKNLLLTFAAHSMEEAEFLCDRLGIFVDGGLQWIGNPKDLKGRYGGSYVFTMTTLPEHEEKVRRIIQHISPNAKNVYHLAGTQKFEIPKQEVIISDVFLLVEKAKSEFIVFAWGLTDTTLEDVFFTVATTAQAFNSLS